jgi:hypothetical protein
MTTAARTNPPLPQGVLLVGSILIACHLLAVAVAALAAPSGPWPTSFGSSSALSPPFAGTINDITGQYGLRPLHLAYHYHFTSNYPEVPEVHFEVRLKDETGKVIKTLNFPDAQANYWVRHRQRLLAQALGDDQPVQAPMGEQVLPQGQQFPTVSIWVQSEMPAEKLTDKGLEKTRQPILRLKTVSLLEIPKNQPVSRPSEWSQLVAKAYVRHLCRVHGAAAGELIRHSRNPIYPTVLFVTGPLPREAVASDELVCNFGE